MSTVNPSAGSDSAYAQYAFPTASKSKTDGMGQADFLRLMTEQMKNQDPLNPLKGNEFLGQLAQFSTVQGIENMQQAMSAMASVMENDQSLRAASLVGRDALVEVDKVKLAEGAGANGEIVATHSGPVQLEVVGAGGQVVRRISVEAAGAGPVQFAWDGKDGDGNALPAGTYTFRASSGSGDSSEALGVRMAARIDSVSIEPTGLVLNLAGLGSMPLSSVRRIG
ncbi:flagellar hook assembly protein FlgD [Thermomonas sp. XSG]|uniref:flagellar hook assembly protein FlgD n=1 Tax=Thermomonas sp. XSG TaxID=2771436 RepID=UPI00168195B3|nr:flagellar hook assembly protein FlgD [Thermomonas sp. XSG]QNU16371.1 flagellar hook assembly protein FlgD [Thermomonas sp. XSG]